MVKKLHFSRCTGTLKVEKGSKKPEKRPFLSSWRSFTMKSYYLFYLSKTMGNNLYFYLELGVMADFTKKGSNLNFLIFKFWKNLNFYLISLYMWLKSPKILSSHYMLVLYVFSWFKPPPSPTSPTLAWSSLWISTQNPIFLQNINIPKTIFFHTRKAFFGTLIFSFWCFYIRDKGLNL